MLRVILFFFFATASFANSFHPDKPIPEIKLSDGRTLRNLQIVSFASSTVMAKWEGGRGTIPYEVFPAEIRSAVEKYKPKTQAASSISVTAPMAPKKTETLKAPAIRTIKGQVFIMTQGEGVYKFAGAEVKAFSLIELEAIRFDQKRLSSGRSDAADQIEAWVKAIGDRVPVATTRTDADANFSITLNQPVFLFCTTYRVYGRNREETCLWLMELPSEKDLVTLDHTNGIVSVIGGGPTGNIRRR